MHRRHAPAAVAGPRPRASIHEAAAIHPMRAQEVFATRAAAHEEADVPGEQDGPEPADEAEDEAPEEAARTFATVTASMRPWHGRPPPKRPSTAKHDRVGPMAP